MTERAREEPIVPIRIEPVAPKVRDVLEKTGAVLLVPKTTSYVRSFAGLAVNVALAVSGPLYMMVEAGAIGGDWSGITAPKVVLGLAPTVLGVVRQWLSRSPGDVEGGKVRDAIMGK